MKILTIILLFVFSLNGLTQQDGDRLKINIDYPILKNESLAIGVYKTFEEFKNNAPSIHEFEVLKQSATIHVPFEQDSTQENQTLDKKGRKSKYIAEHWGFCDGKYIFVYYGGTYSLLEFTGKYSRFSLTGTSLNHYSNMNYNPSLHTTSQTYGGTTVSSTATKYLLNLETGYIELFTLKYLETILQNNDEKLYNDYIAEKKKKNWNEWYLNALNKKFLFN